MFSLDDSFRRDGNRRNRSRGCGHTASMLRLLLCHKQLGTVLSVCGSLYMSQFLHSRINCAGMSYKKNALNAQFFVRKLGQIKTCVYSEMIQIIMLLLSSKVLRPILRTLASFECNRNFTMTIIITIMMFM